jgi:serine phosphatase RsbU (regulator of sigma subunit)
MAMLGVSAGIFSVLNSVSVVHRVRRGEAWVGWFFLAYFVAQAGNLLLNAEWVIAAFTSQQVGMLRSWNLVNSPVPISLSSAGEVVTGAVMAYLLARRLQGLIRDKQALDAELETARQVQELLLQPSERSPGSLVQAAYHPAREVGGDFYFTSALPGDALLLVTGDVSGKGLRAAMLVNLVIGALRRESSSSPAEVLAGLNRVLCGQTAGGFVTCCCARFDPGGAVTVANAGHLPPYVDGTELELEGGLPLGLSPDATYEETVVRGEYFTFVSDGVVEAENSKRELFGFDRTREISVQPAAEIAEAARAWGQNDDITVVTVRRTA